jgi:hypothetical protein
MLKPETYMGEVFAPSYCHTRSLTMLTPHMSPPLNPNHAAGDIRASSSTSCSRRCTCP